MKLHGWVVWGMLGAVGVAGCHSWMPNKTKETTVSASQHDDRPLTPYGRRTRASARHILVKTEQECIDLKTRLARGEDFSELARQCSLCPSGQKGGNLGEFGRAEMSPEFDRVVFNEELGKVHGPVRTKFGYHLIEITGRND